MICLSAFMSTLQLFADLVIVFAHLKDSLPQVFLLEINLFISACKRVIVISEFFSRPHKNTKVCFSDTHLID